MKQILILMVFVIAVRTSGQNLDVLQIDKLNQALIDANADSTRVNILTQLSEAYRYNNTDSSYYCGQQALALSRRINYPSGESKALSVLSYYHFNRGELPKALELGLIGLSIANRHNFRSDMASNLIRLGNVYSSLRDSKEALSYYRQAIAITTNTQDSFFYAAAHWRASEAFAQINEMDSVLFYAKKAEDTAIKMGNKFIQNGAAPVLGRVYLSKGNVALGLTYLRSNRGAYSSLILAEYFKNQGLQDSALIYATRAYQGSLEGKIKAIELSAATLLSELFETNDPKQSLAFLRIAMSANDSLFGSEKILSAKAIEFEEQERQSELQIAKVALRNKIRIFATLAGLLLALLIAMFVFRNYKKEREANSLLAKQKNDLSQALTDLKNTQAQLLQSEKMASLGELTAGIAHEIQNPLNFVNNFSDLNTELIDEMRHALIMGDTQEALQIALDVQSNQDKISNHGKRADTIVKGMLQHSRSSSGIKEPTDINKLTDEYIRLAYQGLRAKDKEFNITLENSFDPAIESVHIIPQDIGRVLLNLYNNAFYAVTEKKKKSGPGFVPVITVVTEKYKDSIKVIVKDNGIGINEQVQEKIFQPFFTTKPTGQGTGLGLSLSYDIIKAHGGTIKVDSVEGEGSVFTILLPTIG